jgi:hypothetical protein
MRRFTGHVTDASNGYALAGVCVIIGPPVDCTDNMPHSDENGSWFADLPVAAGGLLWTFNFVKDGYVTFVVKEVSDAPGEEKLDVTLQPK